MIHSTLFAQCRFLPILNFKKIWIKTYGPYFLLMLVCDRTSSSQLVVLQNTEQARESNGRGILLTVALLTY